jgi:hypothetical protein
MDLRMLDMTQPSEFPRVLMLGPASFNHLTGGGVTFSNLFAGWPKDRLASAHNDVVPTSNDVCERYFVLGRDEMDLIAPLRMVRSLRGDKKAGGAPAAAAPARRGGLFSRLQGDSAPQRVRITPALHRWISDFKPDVLYTILGSNGFMDLADQISRRYSIPVVVHMADDWPSIEYRRGLLAPLEHARMERWLKQIMAGDSPQDQRDGLAALPDDLLRLDHPQRAACIADRGLPFRRAPQCVRVPGRTGNRQPRIPRRASSRRAHGQPRHPHRRTNAGRHCLL